MSFQKIKPLRSDKYLKFVRSLPCVACGIPADDAHHIKGRGLGGGVKPTDLMTIPMCRPCHTKLHDMGFREWERRFGNQMLYVLLTIDKAQQEGAITIT